MVFFSPFSYVFPAALGPPFLRTDETSNFLYTQPCVSDHVRKTNRLSSSRSIPRPCDIRVYRIGFFPPDHASGQKPDAGHTPRKLPRSFPASNLPLHRSAQSCALHARLNNITERLQKVKRFFVIFAEIFASFLFNPTNCFPRRERGSILCPFSLPPNAFRPFLRRVERAFPSLYASLPQA